MTAWIDENDHDESLTPAEERVARSLIEHCATPDEWAELVMLLAAPVALVVMLLFALANALLTGVYGK